MSHLTDCNTFQEYHELSVEDREMAINELRRVHNPENQTLHSTLPIVDDDPVPEFPLGTSRDLYLFYQTELLNLLTETHFTGSSISVLGNQFEDQGINGAPTSHNCCQETSENTGSEETRENRQETESHGSEDSQRGQQYTRTYEAEDRHTNEICKIYRPVDNQVEEKRSRYTSENNQRHNKFNMSYGLEENQIDKLERHGQLNNQRSQCATSQTSRQESRSFGSGDYQRSQNCQLPKDQASGNVQRNQFEIRSQESEGYQRNQLEASVHNSENDQLKKHCEIARVKTSGYCQIKQQNIRSLDNKKSQQETLMPKESGYYQRNQGISYVRNQGSEYYQTSQQQNVDHGSRYYQRNQEQIGSQNNQQDFRQNSTLAVSLIEQTAPSSKMPTSKINIAGASKGKIQQVIGNVGNPSPSEANNTVAKVGTNKLSADTQLDLSLSLLSLNLSVEGSNVSNPGSRKTKGTMPQGVACSSKAKPEVVKDSSSSVEKKIGYSNDTTSGTSSNAINDTSSGTTNIARKTSHRDIPSNTGNYTFIKSLQSDTPTNRNTFDILDKNLPFKQQVSKIFGLDLIKFT